MSFEQEVSLRTTARFDAAVDEFVKECWQQREEIFAKGMDVPVVSDDPYENAFLPSRENILDDVLHGFGIDEDGGYYNCWGITENFDSRPFECKAYLDSENRSVVLAANDENLPWLNLVHGDCSGLVDFLEQTSGVILKDDAVFDYAVPVAAGVMSMYENAMDYSTDPLGPRGGSGREDFGL